MAEYLDKTIISIGEGLAEKLGLKWWISKYTHIRMYIGHTL